MKKNSVQSKMIQICLEFETIEIVLPQCGRRLYSFTAAYPQGAVGTPQLETLWSPQCHPSSYAGSGVYMRVYAS